MKQIYKALSGPTLLSISSGILVLLFFSWWTNSDNTVQEIKSSNNQSLALEQMNGTAEKEPLSAAAKAMMMTYNIDDEDGETIMTCGATLYDSGGPSGDYGNDEDYSVIFCADNGGQMVANLLLDNVEPNGSGGCYDYIGFYDGTSDSDPFISGHCGTGAVPAITSTGGCLFIVFSSDFNRPRSGFEVTLSCTDPPLPAGDADYLIDVEDGEIVETCSGIFSDSGDTNSDYGDDEDYTVTFCSDEDNQISFTFEHFGLDSGDELEIYDGEDTGASLLGTFSGVGEANSPGVVTSSSTCLTFAFTSDGSGTSQGWEASISCTGTPDVSASAGSWSGYSGGSCGNASTIGGTVYEDINNDGTQDARDAPIYGVTVTLFDDDGQVGSPTTTDENGEYTFGSLSDQVYRVEFTVPGDFTEGPYGAGSGTAVQFVEPGVCADLGLVDVVHYCGDTNPFFVIPCYVNGDPQDDQNVIQTGIAGFEYTDSGNSPAPTYENYVTAGAVGTIWGTAYDGNTEKLYMSTFLKRHAGLGPDGIGAIYMHTDGAANTSAPVFYDFGAAAGVVESNAVRFPGSGDGFGEEGPCGTCDNIDPNTFGQVGKVGFGDIEINPENTDLYVTNLNDRKVYKIALDNPAANSATPLPGMPWLDNSVCSNGIARPWALEFRRGKLYVGVVCDASLSSCEPGTPCSDLTAEIYSFDGTTWTNELSQSLDYYRQAYVTGSNYFVRWIDNWSTMAPYISGVTDANFAQPIVSDIEFDDDNALVLGIGDRTSMQLGYQAPPPTGPSGSTAERNMVFGDVLRADYDNSTGNFTMESNGSVGGLSTTNPNGSSGIGGRSFYWGDYWTGIGANRFQGSIGSLAILPGSGEIMTPLADAIDYYSNGIVWMSNTNGASLKRLEVYQGSPNGLEPNFAKSAGVGDLELFCQRPSIEVGNVVWWDDNLNGLQDPSEPGIEGVTIELWIDPNGSTAGNNPLDGSGVKVAETETDEFGRFIFSHDGNPNSPEAENWIIGDRVLPNTAYQIRIPDWVNDAGLIAQRDALGYTEHLLSPTQNQGGNGEERDNNAYDNPGNAASAVLTGLAGENDHSHDFAFGGLGGCDAPTVVPGANTPCNGETLELSATVIGGQAPYTYSWSGPNSFTSSDQNPSLTDIDASLATGTYSLTVTDALECTETVSIEVAINNLTVVATGTDATCGSTDGSIELDITGEAPFTIDWSDNTLDGTEDPTGLAGGLYSVTVTDADGCSSTATASVNSVDAPTLSEVHVDETCTAGNGSITVSIADGASASIAWSMNAPTPVNTPTSSVISGLSAGTYSVTITNTVMALSCSAFLSVTIEDTPAPSLSFSQINETCGSSNASINLSPSGGATPYTFNWSDDDLDGIEDPTGIAAGTYDVTVIDANSCQVIEQIIITNSAPPTLGTVPTDETCGGSNGSIALTVNGGQAPFTYQWSNGLTTEDISSLGAGTYTVTVTDVNGCSAQTSETVSAIDGPTLSVTETDATDCNSADGSVSLSVQGGTPSYSFNWSNGDMTQNLINVAAGTYTVTVTDGNGCTTNITAIVGNGTDPVLTLTVTDPMGCGETGSIDLSVSGGVEPYTFDWSNDGLGEIDDEEDISGLAAGIYTVVVIGSDGCSAQANASIREIRAPILTPSFTNPACGMTDGSIALAISDPDGVEFGGDTYTYTWEDIGVGTATRTNLAPGNYSVTVSNEIGCSTAATFSLNTAVAPLISPNITSPICSGDNGEITLSISGGTPAYSYSWEKDGVALMDNSASLTGQGNGRYDVTVTDAAGCIAATSVELSSSTPPELSAFATPASCIADDGSIDLIISGVAPFTINWGHIGGMDNSEDLSDLAVGTYNVTVTDNNGCESTGEVSIGLFGLPVVMLNDPADECIEGSDMSFTASPAPAMGTTGVFSSSASAGFTDNMDGTADLDISDAGIGTYTVTYTYTDENGCEESETVSVTIYGQDYGDLPDGYPVTQMEDGARHCIPPNPMIYLGMVPDGEADGTKDSDAGEISGGDGADEDGITEPTMLFRGEQARFTVDVVTNTTAYIYAYIDWNNDDSFDGPGEVQSNSTASSGPVVLTFDVPHTTILNMDLGARFRIGSVEDEVDQATGLASDGEVEDYIVQVKGLDYGDLPDDMIADTPDYATSDADDGPRHGLAATPLVFIGTGVEQDNDGQASTDADGDAEEDDVTLPAMLFRGENATFNMNVTNNSDSTAKVVAYFDWNGDGDFEEADEMGSSDPIAAMSVDEAVAITITVPLDAVTDSLFGARFRVSTDTSTIMGSANGFAMDGEVEDYMISIKDLDFGDLPDDQVADTPDYATDYDDDGPRHGLAGAPLVFIGTGVEQDNDGQASTDADGDAEEDDVTLPMMLFRGENATFNMNVTNNSDSTAKVVAYFDWNGDGDFEEADEMGSSDPIAAMSVDEAVAITITVPLDAVTDSLVGARFRVSTDTSTIMGSANGFAMDGEVEDYMISIKDLDFGDLPDDQVADTPDYATDYDDDGPRHGLAGTPLVFIGTGVEQDNDGQASTDADGDVEEDDVTLPMMLFRGENATFNMNVTNNSDSTAKVVAYFDWNGDGDFEEAGEMASSDPIAAMSVNTAIAIPIDVPFNAVVDSLVGARFRVSTDTSTIMGSANGFVMDGEVEDYLISIKDLDFGDLPDDEIADTPDYATNYDDDGPRHGLAGSPLVFIGTGVEQDNDGQASTDADGDAEEDDVTLPAMLFRGENATFNMNVTNNSDSTAKVVAYFDWNGDGDFEEADEMGSSDPIAAMSVDEAIAITILVPLDAVIDSLVGARFRVSTDTSTIMGSANGFVMDGEVEDYLISIKGVDYGDAPDPDYPTTAASDGARHGVPAMPTVYLGSTIDIEEDGQPQGTANGDDNNGDDEDGVVFENLAGDMQMIVACELTTIVVTASTAGYLNAWLDYNGNGSWEDAEEQLFTDEALSAGSNELSFRSPCMIASSPERFLRFRFSTTTGLSSTGFAMDGEVEDYASPVKGLDFGDLPDSPYPTLYANDPARHVTTSGSEMYLGMEVDEENEGPQSQMADGEGDDDDGIRLLTPLVPGYTACLEVITNTPASTTAYLHAWVDFNGDGSLLDEGDQIISDRAFTNADNGTPTEICFEVPETATFTGGMAYMRFRFGPEQGLSPTGLSMDGEVEDYKFNLAKIGNLVWQDNNYDGIQGDASDEAGLNGIEVILTWEGPDGEIGLTADNVTFTDSTRNLGGKDGIYYFCGLIDGEYSLAINTDRFPTLQAEGTVTTDSDNEEGTPVTINLTNLRIEEDGTSDMPGMINGFPDNQDDLSYDFGYAGLDFGDLPETFFTEMEQGPIHALNPNIFLGSCVDGELDGEPDIEAGGDDGSSSDVVFPAGADCSGDEDGVLLLTSLVPGAEACIQVTSTLPVDDDGVLNAWIDFNGNDQFDEGEQLVFTKINDAAITPASTEATLPMGAAQVSELCFNVPSSATFEGLETYMRFRLSPEGELKSFGVNENGSYPSGEVEDYYQPLATLGNYVWLDVNENGIQDANEPPLEGITVRLYQCDSDTKGDEVGIAQVTDENGYYEFIGLLPAEYCVAFDASTAYEPFEDLPYVFSPQVDDGEVDSNPGEDGCTSSIVLAAKEANPSIDAGVIVETCYPPFSLSVEECLEQGATISWKTINGDEHEDINDHCWKLAIAGAGPPHAEFGDLGIILDLLGAGISTSLLELTICEGDPGVTIMETDDPQVHMISYELSSELIQPGTAYWFAVAEICNDAPDLGNNSLWNFQRYFPITLTDEGAFPGTDEQTAYLWDDYEGYFHTKDLPFEIMVETSSPTCPFYTDAYTPDGCLLIEIADSESCWGTYDIYINEMLQAEGVTPADGPFEYCGYGVGTYDIRVVITNECVPIEREHSMSIAIPEGIDDISPSIVVSDYFVGSLIADNDGATTVDTSADLGEMVLPEGACAMKSYFVISGTDNCDNIICSSGAVIARRIAGEESIDPGTQVQLYHLDGEVVTDQGVIEVEDCEWVLEINWAVGASTVEVCMDDAEQVGASEPACITISAEVEDNTDAQLIASPVNALIPVCADEVSYILGVNIIDGCDQSVNTDQVLLSGVEHELLSVDPSGYLEYLLRFEEEGAGTFSIAYTDLQGQESSTNIAYTVTKAAEESAPQIIAVGRSFTALPCEDGAEIILGVNVLDDCDEIDAKVSLSGGGAEVLTAAPVVGNGTRAYFEFSGILAADEYEFTYSYPGAEDVTVLIIVEQEDNRPALIDMPGNTTFSIPSCNDEVAANWSVQVTDDCDEMIDLSELCLTLGDEGCLDLSSEDIEILSNENGAALISIQRTLTAANNGTRFEVSYTDGSGETSTASSIISINATAGNDAIPPVIVYPAAAITRVLDPCESNQTDIVFSVSAIDNCAGVVPVDLSADGSLTATAVQEGDSQKWTITYEARSGPYRIDLSAEDGNGNSTTRSMLISVIQAAAPTLNLSCNTRLSALVDEYCQFRVTPDIALEGTFGCLADEDIVIMVDGQDSPIAQGTGEHEFDIYIEGSFFCRGSILLSDNIAPTIECPTTNKDFICNDLNELLGELEETGTPIVNDNCGATYSWTEEILYGENETCDDVRIKRVFTATDEAGLSSSCEQFIVVRKPNLAEVLQPLEIVEMRCDEVQVYNEEGLPAPIETGGYPYVISYFGPQNINNLYCNLAATYKDVDFVEFCDKSYKFTRTWTVLDWCDIPNVREFSQLIKVGDFESPTLSPPTVDNDWDGQVDILSFSTGPFGCTAAFEIPLPIVTDNCSNNFNVAIEIRAADETLLGSIANGESRFVSGIPLGCHTFEYLVSDDCGNKSSLSVPFMVIDKVEPIAICNDELNVSVNSIGLARVMASEIDEGSWDNCGEVKVEVRRGYTKDEFCNPVVSTFSEWGNFVDFTCCDIGEVVRIEMQVWDDANGDGIYGNTITQFDCAGQAFEYADNSNVCWLDVTVGDELAAYCIAPHDKVVNCDELPYDFDPNQTELFNDLFGEATYNDNCAGVVITEELPVVSLNDCGVGTIVRTFSTTDISGTTSANNCQQLVTIAGQYNYEIQFPADVSADCGEPSPDTITYNEIGCDLLAISVTDETFSASGDECYKIFRTYGVINWCEYNGESPPVIVGRDEDCDGIPGDEAIWVLRRPSGRVYFDRNNDETDNLPVAYTKKNTCDGLTNPSGYWIDSELDADATHDPITGQDDNAQTNDNIRNIDSRGYWQYTQVIKVYDSVDPAIKVEAFDAFSSLDGEDCEGEVVINFSIKDECTQEEGLQRVWLDAFIIDSDEDGNFTQAEFEFDADVTAFVVAEAPNYAFVADLPQGKHALLIEATDGCGNETADLILIEVIDAKAPAPVCLNGLAVELMPTDPSHPDADGDGDEDKAAAAIWANDFIASPVFDCNGQGPDVDLNGNTLITAYSINLVGEEAHRDSTGIVLTCDNDETTIVEIHAWDEAGNHDYCETYVFVQDLMNRCGEAQGAINGYVETEEGEGVQDVEVRLSGITDEVSTTQQTGYYTFDALATNDYSITPHLDVNPLNGISTLDLILMTKHILGEQLLASPYKIIAADVNNSRSVTTLDIVETRRLILGLNEEFANNTSWRFIKKDYVFPNPLNPWAEEFPTISSINDLTGEVRVDFVGVKVADVNTSARANSLLSIDERTYGEFQFDIEDIEMTAGQTYRVEVISNAIESITGYQGTFTLGTGVEWQSIEYGLAQTEHFNTTLIKEGLLPHSWHGEAKAAEVLFTLVLKATENTRLSEQLGLSSRVTPSEAYDLGGQAYNLALNFDSGTKRRVGFELYQNRPNPFKDETVISFYLPEDSEATISVYDLSGKVLHSLQKDFKKGKNTVLLTDQELVSTGTLFYTVTAGTHTASKKMIRLD